MLHRVIFGSIERFIGILIEHFAGAFPLWLSPVQVNVIPVNNEYHLEYAEKVYELLKNAGVRVQLDDRNEKVGYKMRESQTKKIPITLVLGDNEKNENIVTYRLHGTNESISMPIDEFIEKLCLNIENKNISYEL